VTARVAVLTGGGDCPGLNAAIRAVVRRSHERGSEALGVRNGWRGLVEGNVEPLGMREISGILPRGGTILGTTGVDPRRLDGGVERVLEHARGIDAIVAIGGEGTLGVAAELHALHGLPVVGVPKTIDNDLAATDYTIGFDTAVSIATEAIDRLHTTAESHNRVMVVEVMGRESGWIALHAGLAAGADAILVPEHPMTLEAVTALLEARHRRGKDFSIVVVAEGCPLVLESGERRVVSMGVDPNGFVRYGGVGYELGVELERRTGFQTRVTVLGHVQRGGTPTGRDRVVAARLGLLAADLAHERRFGLMAAVRGDDVVPVSLRDATAERKGVPAELYATARALFG
jgi:6-phosphofructokinase 1